MARPSEQLELCAREDIFAVQIPCRGLRSVFAIVGRRRELWSLCGIEAMVEDRGETPVCEDVLDAGLVEA